MADSVAVLGCGVGGMTAAHELAERGFSVAVYEQRPVAGGKARSMDAPGTGTAGRRDLPGEHGFRFIPQFYRHLPDTLGRIPYENQANGVLGNLVEATRAQIARADGPPLVWPTVFPTTLDDVRVALTTLLGPRIDLPPRDLAHFLTRMVIFLTSCEERRFAEYEPMGWWEFVGAAHRSPAYRKFLADGLSRTLVAAKAHEMSARTGGDILAQLILDMNRPFGHADRLLDGPTSDVWIDPWLAHLRSLGVDVHTDAHVDAIRCRDGRVASVTVTENGAANEVRADHYVVALPVEIMTRLVTPDLKKAEPRLAALGRLRTRWMNGIMLYVDRDVPVVHGHTIYIDSPWALTSISQHQFWPRVDLEAFGDGRVEGILSVDVSDWESPGLVYDKPAMQCSPSEIRDEVWAQLKLHLDRPGSDQLEDANLLGFFLDPDIEFPNPTGATNLEPLLINTAGSWTHRPDAVTAIDNLFLASDYVRTHTDLATMEGANEAARRAVNGVLDAAGCNERRCRIWARSEPIAFAPARAYDLVRFKLGLGHQGALLRTLES